MSVLKILSSGTAAGIVTAGLGLLMVNLIHVDFEAEPKQEALEFEINPAIDPIDVRPVINVPTAERKAIEIPPAAPSIDIERAQKPDEDIIDVKGLIPKFPPPILGGPKIVPVVVDRNPEPTVRFPGVMPRAADSSGHCKMVFGVTSSGSTFDIRASYCTDKVFERASIKAASKFKYRPKIQNGVAVEMSGVTTKITYKLLDENGNEIPE